MSEFIIRPCRPSDAEGIHALRVMEGVRENILALPSERLGFCEAYLNGLGPDDHQFAAAVPLPGGGEKIVGTAGLQVPAGCAIRRGSASWSTATGRAGASGAR